MGVSFGSRPGAKDVLFLLFTLPSEINKLIMNYLIIQGYKDAAEKFSLETGLAPNVDLSSIQDRMSIRTAIESGNVDDAVEKVNDLDPEVTL